ncbi:hypothetical protein EUGRSUZ_F01445 [Eucalyptus grandis]|uniref:Uncharacterized protein n=2 Tax=Eucalyptus grandis TaxID=71139 RepID=A0ACC3KF76_EUCGR|nr:hypothetical protein EUGRSUZ_F01445 [Eucalyptus grandis]
MQSDSRSMHVLGKRDNGDRGHPCELFQPNSKLPLAKKTKNALKDKYFQFIDETNFVPLLCSNIQEKEYWIHSNFNCIYEKGGTIYDMTNRS